VASSAGANFTVREFRNARNAPDRRLRENIFSGWFPLFLVSAKLFRTFATFAEIDSAIDENDFPWKYRHCGRGPQRPFALMREALKCLYFQGFCENRSSGFAVSKFEKLCGIPSFQ
jgi:hypothetical protein